VSGLEPGSTLGGYRILARMRAGAMGVLYLARRQGPGGFARPVAIKVIHDHLAQNKRFTRMFVDEAKLSAKIDDPNVVRVEEFGEEGGRYFLVMEYVHGASLAQVIGLLRPRGGLNKEHAVAIAMQICGGLHGAHEAVDDDGTPLGIVHRDVSPHNVLVSFRGYVRVIDFGIAKARQVGGQTKTGSLRGKLAYMPPEQARSARTVDRRADLYCVGLVLWEMLTGRRLFDADSDIAILNQIRQPNIVAPGLLVPGIPKALDTLLLETLSQDPDGRPATGAILRKRLGDAMPSALGVLPADLATLMEEVRRLATTAATGDEDASALYGEEVRRSLTVYAQSLGGAGVSIDDMKATEPSSLERRKPRSSQSPSQSPPDKAGPSHAPPDSSDDDETVANLGKAVDAIEPGGDVTERTAAPGHDAMAPNTAPGIQTRPGAPKRTVRLSNNAAPIAGVLPPPPPPGRAPIQSDPFLVPPPPPSTPTAPPLPQRASPLGPTLGWPFERWREPLVFVAAGIAIGLVVAGLIVALAGDHTSGPPRRASSLDPNAKSAPSAAAPQGRAMPPPPTIIAPPETDPETSAPKPPARPAH
jgi:serine/threonine protein kinase